MKPPRTAAQPGQRREPEELRARERHELARHLVLVDPGAARQQVDHAAIHRHGAERHDDGRQPQFPYQQAVAGAQEGAGAEAKHQHRPDARGGEGAIEQRREHAAQREVRGHGQIHAAHQDHQHLAQCQHDEDGGVVEDVGQVARRGEAGELESDAGDQQ
jgi:hypothetical protein